MTTILTIDDSVDILDLHTFALENDGFKVLTASSGIRALGVIAKHPEIKLILCDVQMPHMSGFQFIERFQLDYPQLAERMPVVLTSGVDVALPNGAVGQIRKMTDLDNFLANIRVFLAFGNGDSREH